MIFNIIRFLKNIQTFYLYLNKRFFIDIILLGSQSSYKNGEQVKNLE